MQTDVLIIGGGCGGLETAIELRRQVPDAMITLVNPSAYLMYRPWLIYLPAQHRRFEQLQVSLQQAATAYRLRLVTDTVRHLDLDHHQAELAMSEPITYSSVVVATGAPADKERIHGAASHALFPCDVAEALRFRDQFLAFTQGVVTVILAGERPGPGLGSKANGLETPVGRGTTRNTSVSFFPARRPSIVSVTPQSEDVLLRGRL